MDFSCVLPAKARPLCIAMSALCAPAALAQTTVALPDVAGFERMTVVGSASAERLAAGAANFIAPEELELFRHTDVHRVLRQVPGLYLVEEDGYGLRPNIGIRGSGIDRNSRITVMEDGVLIAPAPYAAPAAYYFPTMQRMHAVEVRKGSAAVRSGPRTTGGAINLVSTPIPDTSFSARGTLTAGENATRLGQFGAGGRSGNWGWLVEGLHQQTDGFKHIDGGGDSGYELDDYLAKLSYTTGSGAAFYQEVELKLGTTKQTGDETYMGLTLEDFETDPYRRYAASRIDNIVADHDQAELRHYIAFNDRLDLTTAVYRNDFARNWYKVGSVGGRSLAAVLEDPSTYAAEYGWLTGATSPDDAISIRNNNRAYFARGAQTILGFTPSTDGAVSHDVEIGLRYHEDEEDRLQDDDRYRMDGGALLLTTDGAPGTQDNRVGRAEALSVYVHDEIRVGDWILTPGIRYERIDLEQRRWAGSDPRRVGAATAVSRTEVDEVISGIGAVYQIDERWTLLGGVHKGFNSPGPGSDAGSEESINYEAGVRFAAGAASADVVAFYNDYDNLVGTCTASTGGDCDIGDQFAGGEVRMHGLELSSRYEVALAHGLRVPFQLTYTYTNAEFGTSFASGFGEWGNVERGDELPYLPEHQAQLLTGLAAERWTVSLSAAYIGKMRVEAGQGATSSMDATDSYWVLDLAGDIGVTDNLRVFGRVENLLDDIYVAAWRPAGARPGRPRTALIGVSASF
jgi:Fe(3+) dicitrate transport protein